MLLIEQEHYQNIFDYEITPGLPIIILVNGRHFRKLTRNIIKPYSPDLANVLHNTALNSIMEIEGAVFGYQFKDETIFLLAGDGAYNNKIQKIVSVAGELFAINFLKCSLAADDPPDLIGEALFDCFVFALPTMDVVTEYFILKQKECSVFSIANAAESELTKIHRSLQKAEEILYKKKTAEKLEILEEYGIRFDEAYPRSFCAGVCMYKVPRLLRTKSGDINRKKWILDTNVPDFEMDKNFLMTIFTSGCDVFRAERDLIIQD